MASDDTDYLSMNKLRVPPGAKAGTLASDMGNQGPTYRRSATLDLSTNMHHPGDGPDHKERKPVTAKLRELMKQ